MSSYYRSTRSDGRNFRSMELGRDSHQTESTNRNNVNDCRSRNSIPVVPSAPATAPYNFIPISNTVVPVQKRVQSMIKNGLFTEFYPDLRTGFIAATLVLKTPLFVGEDPCSERFFTKGGQPLIPGSSLRGMLRTLVQIISWSRFKMYDDQRVLYYRGLADKSPLKGQYVKAMSADPNSSQYKFKAGYLVRQGKDYFIIPATGRGKDGRGFTTINTISTIPRGEQEFKITENFRFADLGTYTVTKIADACGRLEWKRRDIVDQLRQLEEEGYANGFIVTAGDMEKERNPGESKHHLWVVAPPDVSAQKIPVSEADILAHERDEMRSKDTDTVDPLKKVRATPDMPCFYIERTAAGGGKRISFGHTGYFRLAYDLSIGEHVPASQHDDAIMDMDDALFGRVGTASNGSTFAGRVFVEDARSEGPVVSDSRPAYPDVLSSPKPTSFQMYLEQPVAPNINSLRTYNDKAAWLRGYKLYWHKEPQEWQAMETERKKHPKQYRPAPITPVTQASFRIRIRFVNLTDEELGGLLTALDLPEGCCHKLGMGKPLGLGTVSISNVNLHLTNRVKRYQALFNNDSFEEGTYEQTKTIEDFENDFSKYILDHLSKEDHASATTLWETPRMQALKLMLTRQGVNSSKAGYMGLDCFKQRPVLPHPDKVSPPRQG